MDVVSNFSEGLFHMNFNRLLFGTAGVPNSTPRKNNPIEGVKQIHSPKVVTYRDIHNLKGDVTFYDE